MKERLSFISVIVIAGILTYLCAPLSGFLSIDVAGMINFISSETFTFKDLFLGGASEYFRPLVVISYKANAAFWGTGAPSFHVVNIAIHIANSLLLYWLALVLLEEREDKEWVAFLGALFFVVSPLNSEAVIWVSARPDLMCTFFFLCALVLLVKERENPSPRTLSCFAAAYLASLASKEASIALAGIAPLFLLLRARREQLKAAVIWSVSVFALTAVYLLFRSGRHLSVDKGVASVVTGVVGKVSDYPSYLDALGGYGFYLKKLVVPFPLNFTIVSYQKPTAFLALALALVGAYYLHRRYQKALLPLLVVFIGIVPPVLAYIGRIPWVPFGERYLYLPMVGFSLLVAMVFADLKKMPRVLLVVCLLLLAIPTIYRVSLWCDRIAFWQDSTRQAPDFPKSYSALGVAALEEKRYDDAERYIKKAQELGFGESVTWQNLARVYLARKEYDKYEAAMVKAASRSLHPTPIYQDLIMSLMISRHGADPLSVYAKAIKYNLLALSKDPAYLNAYYNVGKLYYASGDLSQASHYLKLYVERDKNGLFVPFAFKMISKIAATEMQGVE